MRPRRRGRVRTHYGGDNNMADDNTKNVYDPNNELEDQAKKMGAYEVSPIVTRIHQKIGIFNLIRNAKNAREVAVKSADEVGHQGE